MKEPERSGGWRNWLATMPAIGVALLPRFT
jgi:hypothetical protein